MSWFEEVPIDYLFCRDLHHAWRYSTARRTPRGFERILSCGTCEAVKIQMLHADGTLYRTKIEYPDGYLRSPGMGRVTRQENAAIRLLNIERIDHA